MTVVWGEINAVTLGALVAQFITLIVFLTRTSDRAISALEKAKKALELLDKLDSRMTLLESMQRQIEDARDCAEKCKTQITVLQEAFALYREMIAREYITSEMLTRAETRIGTQIAELGKHIEWMIQNRGPVHASSNDK